MRSFLLIILLCAALPGCSDVSDPLRIGSNRWLGYAPLYLADDLQWLEPSGFRLLEYPNSSGVLRAFRNGLLDAAMLTLDETLRLRADGHDLEILLVTDISAGADVVYALPPIEQLGDLRGRTLGVEDTALGAFLLARLLDQASLKVRDVRVVSLPVQEHLGAMREGRIDAVITFASEGPQLLELGARPLLDSRAFPNEIIDVLVVDRQRVSPQARRRLHALWHESLSAWELNHQYVDPVLLRRLGLSPAGMQSTHAGLLMGDRALNQQLHEHNQLLASLQWLHHYQIDRGLLERPIDYRSLLSVCGSQPC